jgi:hypothetical protein
MYYKKYLFYFNHIIKDLISFYSPISDKWTACILWVWYTHHMQLNISIGSHHINMHLLVCLNRGPNWKYYFIYSITLNSQIFPNHLKTTTTSYRLCCPSKCLQHLLQTPARSPFLNVVVIYLWGCTSQIQMTTLEGDIESVWIRRLVSFHVNSNW